MVFDYLQNIVCATFIVFYKLNHSKITRNNGFYNKNYRKSASNMEKSGDLIINYLVWRSEDFYHALSTGLLSQLSGVFLFRGKGEKRTPDTFTARVVCRPLTKVSVNICVIVMCQILSEIQAVCNEGGYYRNDVYLPALQSSGECHVKLIQ